MSDMPSILHEGWHMLCHRQHGGERALHVDHRGTWRLADVLGRTRIATTAVYRLYRYLGPLEPKITSRAGSKRRFHVGPLPDVSVSLP
jgi:hypothetical protein